MAGSGLVCNGEINKLEQKIAMNLEEMLKDEAIDL